MIKSQIIRGIGTGMLAAAVAFALAAPAQAQVRPDDEATHDRLAADAALARVEGRRKARAVIDAAIAAWAANQNAEAAKKHEEMGFYDGWGTMITQMEEIARGL